MNNDNSNTTQAFWVLLGSFSAFFVSILSAALLSRFLSKEDYGTYRQILYVYNTLLVVFSAGLPRIFQYFLPRHEINEGKSIVNRVTNLLLLLGLFFSLFLYFFSDQIANLLSNQELSIGLKYFSPIPFLLLPTLGIEGIFASYKKTKYIAKYNVITRFLQLLGIVVPVILFDGGYLMAIFGWSITSLITLLIAIYFKNIPFVKIASISKTKLSYKEIFSYSLPLVFASLAGIAFKSANQFYISRYFGAEIFAEYANGFMELPFVVMITGATSTVMMPLFSKMFYDKDSVSSILKVWNNAIVKSAIIIYPLVVFFIANAQNIMVILYTAKYSNSGIYFKINLVVNFLNIVIFAPLFFQWENKTLC
ncbi:oligosaccharide flippase family protein [Flavobacterium sp.]|uniref:oligosaccharide flippase family protein n=1 Tax=Flavobacterium sp. TaxID=239 RepID=UPI0035293635